MEHMGREYSPLLIEASGKVQRYHASGVHFDNAVFEEESTYEDDVDSLVEQDESNIFKEKKNYGKSMMLLDGILFVSEYLQLFALLQSLSLRWTWPPSWINSFSFLFIFNLDVWELAKVASGAYVASKDSFVNSADVPISYRGMLLGWLIALILLSFVLFVLYRMYTNHLQVKELNILMTAFIISAQVLAYPIGVQIGKLFWCQPINNVLDVDNTVTCWNGEHWLYIVLALLVAIPVFLVYPIWLARKINCEVISHNSRKHEEYLKLKHCEQIYQIDSSWSERLFISFASFRRFWSLHRPVTHIIKFVIICFYAGLFNDKLVQISLIFAILTIQILISLAWFPYRVTSFNFPHLWCLLCLWSSSLIGTMKSIPGIQSVFLLPSYMEGELILINVAWIAGMILWFIYILLRSSSLLCPTEPLWPSLLDHGKDKLDINTERYVVACINGRDAITRANAVPALLAPVQDLAHHIKVLNAMACEAEYIRDPLHSSLRDVLDDVMQLHNTLTPVSIFTESLKTYVQTTINKLIQMLPAFTQRLQQREFDMILVRPVRRRMLLKLFAVSCFMQAGRQKRPHEHGIRKLWSAPSPQDGIFDEGFHEDESVTALNSIEIATRQAVTPRSSRNRGSDSAPIISHIEESFA